MRSTHSYKFISYRLDHVLGLIDSGQIGLPDFQRRFEWSSKDVTALLSTVLAGLPSGTILFAESKDVPVALNPLDGAPPVQTDEASILLDGQQRLTALYQAIRGIGPYRYAVDLTAVMEGEDLLQDQVVVSVKSKDWNRFNGTQRHLGRVVVPVASLFSDRDFFRWLAASDYEQKKVKEIGDAFANQIHPLENYDVPILQLDSGYDLESVAQIFERLNKWGQPLDSFDLLVARAQSPTFSLRRAWSDLAAQDASINNIFGENGLLAASALALSTTGDVRRRAVLAMPTGLIEDRWNDVAAATSQVAQILNNEGVANSGLLPYDNIAIAMIALRLDNPNFDERALSSYFWMASVGTRYDSASNTKVVADYRALGRGESIFESGTWLPSLETIETCTKRSSSAMWSAIVCSMLANEPFDLATRLPIFPERNETYLNFELLHFASGGGDRETDSDVPIRLRALGRYVALQTSRSISNRRGFTSLVESAHSQPALIGKSIDEMLARQFFPPAEILLAKDTSPRDVVAFRAREFARIVSRKAGELP